MFQVVKIQYDKIINTHWVWVCVLKNYSEKNQGIWNILYLVSHLLTSCNLGATRKHLTLQQNAPPYLGKYLVYIMCTQSELFIIVLQSIALLLSEVLPFLTGNVNGIVHAVHQVLKSECITSPLPPISSTPPPSPPVGVPPPNFIN